MQCKHGPEQKMTDEEERKILDRCRRGTHSFLSTRFRVHRHCQLCASLMSMDRLTCTILSFPLDVFVPLPACWVAYMSAGAGNE